MVLSRPDILDYLESGKLRIHPHPEPSQIAQVSIDLHLGRNFSRFKQPGYLPAIQVDPSLWESGELWNHQEQDTFRLNPGEFVLAQTLERIVIPNDLVGFVEGRSSFARVGVTIHLTAPKIDPGFDGTITLEMANFGPAPVELRAKRDLPAQLILMQISQPLEGVELYGGGKGDVFQYQDSPIPRREND